MAILNKLEKPPLRRSPLNRWHESQGASFINRSGGQLVGHYLNEQPEQAQQLAIADLSCLSRVGFKGADTADWLTGQGLALPEKPNQAVLSNGLTVLRLSDTEFFIVDELTNESGSIEQLRKAWSMDLAQQTYLLERADSHAWFALTGDLGPQVLSKVCAVDMRLHKFDQYQVAQTSVARSNAIVLRSDFGNTPNFFVMADLTSSQFLWDGLLDAMHEFNGKAVGLNSLLKFCDQ